MDSFLATTQLMMNKMFGLIFVLDECGRPLGIRSLAAAHHSYSDWILFSAEDINSSAMDSELEYDLFGEESDIDFQSMDPCDSSTTADIDIDFVDETLTNLSRRLVAIQTMQIENKKKEKESQASKIYIDQIQLLRERVAQLENWLVDRNALSREVKWLRSECQRQHSLISSYESEIDELKHHSEIVHSEHEQLKTELILTHDNLMAAETSLCQNEAIIKEMLDGLERGKVSKTELAKELSEWKEKYFVVEASNRIHEDKITNQSLEIGGIRHQLNEVTEREKSTRKMLQFLDDISSLCPIQELGMDGGNSELPTGQSNVDDLRVYVTEVRRSYKVCNTICSENEVKRSDALKLHKYCFRL